MDKKIFLENCSRIYSTSELNQISPEKALTTDLVGVTIFNEPLIKITSVDNLTFSELKEPTGIGPHHLLPTEWLPHAKSVISFFFPFTEEIRQTNRQDMSYPSQGWMNGRIEGQSFINSFSSNLISFMNAQGFTSLAPSIDPKFLMNTSQDRHQINQLYTSNWSERHIAYACGLGTFSLSKGLITEKGIAGRITSVITELLLPDDSASFSRFDENCILCGKCIKNCPVGAISFENGKNHDICSAFLDSILEDHSPWYGCGKCQVNVPCESKNPAQKNF